MKSKNYSYYKCQYRKDWSSIFNLRKKRSMCIFFRFPFRTSNKKGIKICYASTFEFDCLGHYKSQMHQEIANFLILLCKQKVYWSNAVFTTFFIVCTISVMNEGTATMTGIWKGDERL